MQKRELKKKVNKDEKTTKKNTQSESNGPTLLLLFLFFKQCCDIEMITIYKCAQYV
jgi:hypothetical protein